MQKLTSLTKTRRVRLAALLRLSLMSAALATAMAASAADVPPRPALPRDAADPARELQRLQQGVDRFQAEQEVQRLRGQQEQGEVKAPSAQVPQGANFSFVLKKVTHNPSAVLSDAEIDAIVAPYLDKKMDINALKEMLGAINARYYALGYVVCEARLKPQRIHNGELAITLIEGKTEAVDIKGAKHTNERWIKSHFNLKEGEVANYREMSEDLVRFNMVNDVELSIDIRAGNAPETTRYEITAHEPDLFGVTVFGDTNGPTTTGRFRAGASITDRSVFGIRDSLMLLVMGSMGSQSALATYSIPLWPNGPRLSVSGSMGRVTVKNGPSAEMEVTGKSHYVNTRLDQPVYVTQHQKWTLFAQYMDQYSLTRMFDVDMNETTIRTTSAGFEGLLYGEGSVYYLTSAINHAKASEETFQEKWQAYTLTGNAFGKWRLSNVDTFSASANWQTHLGGDDLVSSQQFYLGNGSGIRGYANDLISADRGVWLNLEVERDLGRPFPAVFAFFDTGRLWGNSVYKTKRLSSVGAGLRVPLWKNASIMGQMAIPLNRNVDGGLAVDTVRFDASFIASW